MFLPISSLIISFGFSLGPTFQRVAESLVFVLMVSPYEPGDRVFLSGVGGGTTVLIVQQVHFLITEFADVLGKRLIARNSDIFAMVITNLRLSASAAFKQTYTVDMHATPSQLAALDARVQGYIAARPLEWRPTGTIMNVAVSTPNNLEVTYFLTHVAPWGEGGRVWPSLTDFNVFMVEALQDLGIFYQKPVAFSSAPPRGPPCPQRQAGAGRLHRRRQPPRQR